MESNLDLVKIAPQAKPPVCKVMDYGKYRFEQAKREKENKKNQRTFDIKEVRLSLNLTMPLSLLRKAIRLRFQFALEVERWVTQNRVMTQ